MVNSVLWELHLTVGLQSKICHTASQHNTAQLLPYVSHLFAVNRGECVLNM